MDLARLDLNLLVALDALLRERSVTRAAAAMQLSQPSLSAALAKLRRHFDDDLLTRVGNEYRLTPLANGLAEPVRQAMVGTERVFAARPGFDPATSTRQFTVTISDYAVAVLGGPIARLLAEEAPNTRLRLTGNHSLVVERTDRLLVAADLLILPHGVVSDLSHQDLFADEWVCVVDGGFRGRLGVADLRTRPWVVTSHAPTDLSPAIRQLQMFGIEPAVQIATESFLTVPALIVGSDRIALLQRRLLERLPPGAGIRALPCPLRMSPLIEAMWWHPTYDDEPQHSYLRDVVLRAAQAVGGSADPGRRHRPSVPDPAPFVMADAANARS